MKHVFHGIRILMLFTVLLLAACRDHQANAQQGKPATMKAPAIDIHTAVATGNMQAVQQHLSAGTDINMKDAMGGSSPLITAALYDQLEIATYLIGKGADLNFRNNDGSTPLHVAAFFCKPRIVKLLLDQKANRMIKNKYGDTPYQVVAAPFSSVKPIYVQMKQMLEPIGVKIDLAEVEKLRPEIASMLK